MPPVPTGLRRALNFLFSDPAAVALLTAVYVAAGVVFVITDYTLNNEGMLTYYWASWARQDFAAAFFFQRLHPVLCALYAPVTSAGPHATMIAHVAVGATAIPMLSAVARSLGYRFANLPAFLVTFSPVHFFGGAAGFSNVDAVVGIALVLYLLQVRRLPMVAGGLIGALPWVRFELATFGAVMAIYALAERRRGLLLGMALFPAFYALAGMFYHGDALWLLHFPPSAPRDPANPIYHSQLIGLRYFLEPAAALTPVAACAAATPLRSLGRLEIALLAYTGINVVAIDVLPILGIANFGNSARYLLHVLPALALFACRAVESWSNGHRPTPSALLATAILAIWISTRQVDVRAVQILMVAYALLLSASWMRRATGVLVMVASMTLAGPLLPLRTEVVRSDTAGYLDPLLAWLKTHPERAAQPIYTNIQLLAPFLERRQPEAVVYHLGGLDMGRELRLLTNPRNGQRDRIVELSTVNLYGRTLLPPVRLKDLPDNALLMLREDIRLPFLLPDLADSRRVQWLVQARDHRIGVLRPLAETAEDSGQ